MFFFISNSDTPAQHEINDKVHSNHQRLHQHRHEFNQMPNNVSLKYSFCSESIINYFNHY